VYRALLDPQAIAAWRAPDGMTCHVHAFDPREGGRFRVSLTYDGQTDTGKTTADTDTYFGVVAKLVPDRQVVEVIEFETADPAMPIPQVGSSPGEGRGADPTPVDGHACPVLGHRFARPNRHLLHFRGGGFAL
jgi:uncharacterized protein YndB with AHSA1/START domain